MNDIINLLLTILIIFLTVKFLSFEIKRGILLQRLYELKKSCNAKITLHKCIFLPKFKDDGKADISVEIRNTVYLLRLYSGMGISKSVHFASKNYSVIYMKMSSFRVRAGGRVRGLNAPVTVYAKVKIVPDFVIPEDRYGRLTYVPVLLFCPAPGELSYVSKEKTSVKIAFTDDEVYGMKVFTSSTFASYADRMSRINDEFMYF